MSGSLDRNRIMKLFGELSEELEREGLRGHVYIVGGAALIAGFGRKRSTHDVDGKIVYEKRGVAEAARRLAKKHDLPVNWLNENAALFMPHKDDSQATTVFNSPALVVTGASAKHLLAMKIDAGRPEDVDDIQWLLEQSANQQHRRSNRGASGDVPALATVDHEPQPAQRGSGQGRPQQDDDSRRADTADNSQTR